MPPPGRSAAPAPAPRAPSRMTLDAVHRGRRAAPDRIVVAGVEGVGKSTFAADAPAPIFLCAEDGVRFLDTASFPEPKTWQDALDAAETLLAGGHDFRTFVVDSVDWLEGLIHDHVCRANGWATIEEPGYGKGYVPAVMEFRRFLALCDRLRRERGMEIILVSHVAIKTFSNPGGADYSRYEPKLQKGASALLKEWADVILFATFDDVINEGKGFAKGKGISTGRRIAHTVHDAAWDAKNRHGLPETIGLSYAEFDAGRKAGTPAPVPELAAQARELADARLDGVERGTVLDRILLAEKAGDGAGLAKAIEWLRGKPERAAQ